MALALLSFESIFKVLGWLEDAEISTTQPSTLMWAEAISRNSAPAATDLTPAATMRLAHRILQDH